MYILGLQIGDGLETDINREVFAAHDSAAVLLRDGEVVAAIEEERLSRVKHCNFFPKRAVDFCLREANIGLEEVNYIAVNYSAYDAHLAATKRSYENCSIKAMTGREYISRNFRLFYDMDVSEKLSFCGHHEAHAWSAFVPSGFDESLVVILDGSGPGGDGTTLSGVVGVAGKSDFEVIRKLSAENSLGIMYTALTKLIGYDYFDEYKVMGLAPYGDPARFRDAFSKIYRLNDDGEFNFSRNCVMDLWQELSFMEEFKLPRRKGEPFLQAHKDFAAALQETLESIVLHILKDAQKKTGMGNLCYAGGVAHNCTLNGKIMSSGIFKKIFVQPAAHDAGCALGAALHANAKYSNSTSVDAMKHLYLGKSTPDNNTIQKELAGWGALINFERSADICKQAARLLSEGAVIGWVQGKSEFGPRALGNRSILADPRPAENKERINRMIKKREGYRPFAPSVLEEWADDIFEIDRKYDNYLFMNLITKVRPDKRESLGAITHVDGTARVQVVKREYNEKYWNLVNEFRRFTDTPLVLNTSFNNNAEPIVETVSDAVACFLTTELTHLVIGDYLIEKNVRLEEGIPGLRAFVRESSRLCLGYRPGSGEFEKVATIEFNASRFFSSLSVPISMELYQILSNGCDNCIDSVAKTLGIPMTSSLLNEIVTIWTQRMIALEPDTSA